MPKLGLNLTFRKEDKKKSQNDHIAAFNEILTAFHLAGGWQKFDNSSEAKNVLKQRAKFIKASEYIEQDEKAQWMVDAFLKWAKSNNFKGAVQKVWWTAKPIQLKKATKQDPTPGNPSDLLAQFPGKKFLGLSAKTTQQKSGDIGSKNPGIGSSVDEVLGTKLRDILKKHVDEVVEQFSLSPVAKARKKEIRANPLIQKQTRETGTMVMEKMRDHFLRRLKRLSHAEFKAYLLEYWIDAKKSTYPPYIKVTGLKTSAKVEDPLKNDKLTNLEKGPIKLAKAGTNSITVMANNKRVMRMRFKFADEPMASSMKLSADPWK